MTFVAVHPEAGCIDATLGDLGCGLAWSQVHKVHPRVALTCPDCGHGALSFARGFIAGVPAEVIQALPAPDQHLMKVLIQNDTAAIRQLVQAPA